MTAILIIGVIFLIYLFSTRGRTGHPGLSALQNRVYAHRGLFDKNVPENSMTAFQLARDMGFGIELDVHLLADGNLVVIHDSNLERTTGKPGRVEDLTTPELKNYKLANTDQTIPLFTDVLKLCGGKIPLIVEVKSTVSNYAELCQKVCQILEGYSGVYCVESFDPRCVLWLKKHRPDLIRGQLAQNYITDIEVNLPWCFRFLLTYQMLNFLTKPDFIAYRFHDRKTLSNEICRKIWKMQGVTWTIKSQQDFEDAVFENWLPIFEGFIPQ